MSSSQQVVYRQCIVQYIHIHYVRSSWIQGPTLLPGHSDVKLSFALPTGSPFPSLSFVSESHSSKSLSFSLSLTQNISTTVLWNLTSLKWVLAFCSASREDCVELKNIAKNRDACMCSSTRPLPHFTCFAAQRLLGHWAVKC